MSDDTTQAVLSVPTAQRLVKGVTDFEQMDRSAHPHENAPPRNLPGWYHVKSVQGDYLTCRSWDGTTEGTVDIYIAKPPWLRQTPYNGLTITYAAGTLDDAAVVLSYAYQSGTKRTITKGAATEVQFIVPAYVGTGTGYKGEEIWAAFVGVTGVNDPNNKPIGLVEIYSTRMWAKK